MKGEASRWISTQGRRLGRRPIIPTARSRRVPRNEGVAALRSSILDKLTYHVGKARVVATERDWFVATALAVRDRVVDRWMASTNLAYQQKSKRVYYLSLEFLIGRLLFDVLNNLGLTETARAALRSLDVDLDALRTLEPDAALGNGGLGRLAACYMESMASVGVPAHGYGIRYDHGLFQQVVKNGWQQEYPEEWLSLGNPWEFERAELVYDIGFGGSVEEVRGDGRRCPAMPGDRRRSSRRWPTTRRWSAGAAGG